MKITDKGSQIPIEILDPSEIRPGDDDLNERVLHKVFRLAGLVYGMAQRLLSIVRSPPPVLAGNHDSVFLARRAHVLRAARRFAAGALDLAS
jgi:hypothetical protein